MDAVKRGDLADLRRWARQGVRIVSPDPVLSAAFLGNIAVLQCLIKELGADVNQEQGKHGYRALFIAAANGSLAVMRCLVQELGADVNKVAKDGITPLCIAVITGNLNVARYLAA
jgi:ankyrin repeat protein